MLILKRLAMGLSLLLLTSYAMGSRTTFTLHNLTKDRLWVWGNGYHDPFDFYINKGQTLYNQKSKKNPFTLHACYNQFTEYGPSCADRGAYSSINVPMNSTVTICSGSRVPVLTTNGSCQ